LDNGAEILLYRLEEDEMQIDPEHLPLQSGIHQSPEEGMSILELASSLAHQPFSAHPTGVSGVLIAYLSILNDGLNDHDRQLLKPYARRVLGTAASPARERQRSLLALDWQIRVILPLWLRVVKMANTAETLAALPMLTLDLAEARSQTASVMTVAHHAVQQLTGIDVTDIPTAMRWAQAWTDAGGDGAAAIFMAAEQAVYLTASDAAEEVSWPSAVATVEDAVRACPLDLLAPTVAQMQANAFALLDRLIVGA